MGLQVLRDAYALASCDAFIYGLSQVAFGVLFIKRANKSKFTEIVQIEMRINRSGGTPREYFEKES